MSKTNAKSEFLNHLGYSNSKVICAIIQKGDYGDDVENIERSFILTTGYTKEDWDNFLSKIDFMYNSGYGGQELYGTIWFQDGNWSDRGEYDGSEWWQYHRCPDIPDNVRRIDKERDQKINEIIK